MMIIQHKFVDLIPDKLDDRVLYVSLIYKTAVHNCICGCGNSVVTPISPTDWQMIFNGKSISLKPSIGNWNFECRSHYWITKNRVIIANDWNYQMVQEGRKKDKARKKNYYQGNQKESSDDSTKTNIISEKKSIWEKLLFWK